MSGRVDELLMVAVGGLLLPAVAVSPVVAGYVRAVSAGLDRLVIAGDF